MRILPFSLLYRFVRHGADRLIHPVPTPMPTDEVKPAESLPSRVGRMMIAYNK